MTLGRIILFMFFTMFSLNEAYAEVTKKVVSQGVGASLDSALQNAAEQALMQVVGTYIDTETLISKRTEIKDGLKLESKNINSELLEFSNGTIKNLEVLEVSNENGIHRVQAVVDVRVEDLTILIEPFTAAKTNISKGLFAGIKENKEQDQDKLRLINKKIIEPLLSGKFIETTILGLKPLGQEQNLIPAWIENLNGVSPPSFLPIQINAAFTSSKENLEKRFGNIEDKLNRIRKPDESFVVLSYQTEITQELQTQIRDILEKVSFKRYRYDWLNTANNKMFLTGHRQSDSNKIICIFEPIFIDCFIIDIGKPPKQSREFNVENYLSAFWNEKVDRALSYRTKISFFDEESKEVFTDIIVYPQRFPSADGVLNSSAPNKSNRHLSSAEHKTVSYRLMRKALFIPFVSNDLIYMKLKDETLSRLKSLEIKFEESEEFIKQTNGGIN